MFLQKILYHRQKIAGISYAALLTALLMGFTLYFALKNLALPILGANFLTTAIIFWVIFPLCIFWLTKHFVHRLAGKDYKISIQLQNICFALLFITLIIIGSALWKHDPSLATPYIHFILIALPAIFFHATRTLHSTGTGHLLFGVTTFNLLSAFIPAALCHLVLYALPLSFVFAESSSWMISQNSMGIFSMILPLTLLYFFTPYWLKERKYYSESRESFIQFAVIIQFLILPLYFALIPELHKNLQRLDIPFADEIILKTILGVIVPVMALCGISILWRKKHWLKDANLLARDALSPLTLSAILIFLKIPIMAAVLPATFYLDAIALPIDDLLRNHFPLLDFIPQMRLLDYLPALYLTLLIGDGSAETYVSLLPFAAIVTHIPLLMLTFWVMNRFLPQIFAFAILFIIPVEYPELLLLISYAGLLFDRKLLQNPTLWSAVWFGGGIVFFLLSPLYALFFLLGSLPYVAFTFFHFYRHHAEHTRNLILLYGFLVLTAAFSDFVRKLLAQIFAIIAPHWLFGAHFDEWKLYDANDWGALFYYLAFPSWLGLIVITGFWIFLFRKKLMTPAKSSWQFGDWVWVSCTFTLLLALPVIVNALIGFDSTLSITRLFYVLFLFAVPMILFRGKYPQSRTLPFIGCAASFLLIIFTQQLTIPEFNALFAHISQ